ncbi:MULTISPECIES: hypothetical protein [Enterobacter cloacae complex]|uniref:hypothetical protein n=1 Tax=Enterobacter cloacae complex TaxID=354276 RepID=UPI0006501175|nr:MULTISPECIES: hypothetical protein [Enterobacter cloacae complex]EHN8739427.1 hypothetical protein [Enterobacter hormaechei]EHN8740308.1 hypothetical protein [Enterobacter hormaechei]EHN8838862.1 hypothetical protein [Enterobacter hormaechei]EHN8839732.1 hypothetical protein [Enterobacter hormaechei]EKK5437097.1 hypothetical protein [Enterobacter hormaechei]
MAIEAIAIDDLVDVAREVNCDLHKLVITGADKEAKNAQKHELAKLLPALESGAVNQSVILKFAAQAKEGSEFSTISSATLNKWVNELNANGGKAPDAPAASTEASKGRGRPADSTGNKVSITRDDLKVLQQTQSAYHALLSERIGKKLVSEADALVIESIKTNNAAYYNSVLEGIQKQESERIKEEIRLKYQAMMDQEIQEKLAAFQPIPVEEAPVIDPGQEDEPTFTPADEPETPVSGSKKK